MDTMIFQNIFDKISSFLPMSWKNIIYFAGYTEGSYSMKFYVENGDGRFVDCFSMPGVTRAGLIKTFVEIDKLLSKERQALGEEKKWTVFTMRVNSDGHMKTDFEYDDHSEDMVSYEEVWQAKYLKGLL